VHDVRRLEVDGQPRAVDFERLLVPVSLRKQRQFVPLRQVRQGLRNILDDLHRLLQDGFGEAHDRLQIVRRERALGEPLVAFAQIPAEVGRPVAVDPGVDPFDVVEHVTDLRRRQRRVREILDELIERALEVDVVFPERVVGVDDEVLSRHSATAPRCGIPGIQGDGGPNERLQRLAVQAVAFVDVDGAPDVAFETGIEEA